MKVCIICFDFKKSNVELQPWRYIYEIIRGMKSMDIDVEVITDGAESCKDEVGCISVYRLKRFRPFPFFKNEVLIRLINEKSPDIIIWMVGPTSYYFIETFKSINKPIIGIWMTTVYSTKQIISLGTDEIIRNFDSIILHVINALMPISIKKSVLKLSTLKKIIVLNNNAKKFIENGSNIEISVIPPGITDYDLELPDIYEVEKLKKEMTLRDSFIILYLGSPKSIRGIDILINAVSIIYKEIPRLKLIILSRRRAEELIVEENYIKNLCKQKKIEECTNIISGFLNRDVIKKFILLSDVVALPFKLVQSDTPISILEVMALGKPVISTKLDGIPELLKGRGYYINPNNKKDLAEALLSLYYNPQMRKDIGERAREYMLKYPTWDETTNDIVTLINRVI